MNDTKTIIRVRKNRDFVIVSRYPLEDLRLTWEARGLYGFLLAKPDNWQISLSHLTKSSPAGYDKTKRVLAELVGFKYVKKAKRRTHRGRFTFPEYTIYELPYDGYFTGGANPSTVKPLAGNSDADTPPPEDPPLTKKQSTKEEIETTTTDLIWPEGITEADRASIIELSKSLEHETFKKILAEMPRTLEGINSPVSYYYSLLQRHEVGTLVFARSNSVCKEQEGKKLGEERYQELLRQSEERAYQLFKEKGGQDG